MAYSKDQLLTRLQELQIDFARYEHPVVLTVEAQAKHVGHLGGGLSKNLFLKDKKHRYYIVSALADTKIDLKVLSRRLGLGKQVLRMAPEEALQEILKVPLGCVTPFALVNESARHVSLLLDQGFKTQECCFFHPLANDMSISLNARDLDKFLNSIGKDPSYVDLEADPRVGKDQPPDLSALVPSESINLPDTAGKDAVGKDQPPGLAAHVPSESINPPDTAGKAASLQCPENCVPAVNKATTVTAKAVKPPLNANIVRDKTVAVAHNPMPFADAEKFVEEILNKTSALGLAGTEATVQQHGEKLGPVVSDKTRKRLCSELTNLAVMFKNAAYNEGFHAGKSCQPKRCM